jgi:hypothetical protein
MGAVLEGHAAGAALEEDAAELVLAFLECEVDVAGGGAAEVGDLALDPHVGEAEVALEELLEVAADVGDRVGV